MPSAQKRTASFHQLRWLSVVGGFLDGLKIEFAPGLNCIIGGRGTGKLPYWGSILLIWAWATENGEHNQELAAAGFGLLIFIALMFTY